MLKNTSRNVKLLAGGLGVNLALALAVSAGAVPTLGEHRALQAGSATQVEEMAAPAPRQPGDVTQAAAAAALPAPPTTMAAPTTTVVAPRPTGSPAKAKAPATNTPQAATAPSTAATVATAVTVPAPVKVLRRVPSGAEVNHAIAILPQYVRTPFTPTPAQVDQLGDQVCTAFDEGQTFAQVKATGLSMVTQVPFTTVLPGGADWVVKTAVTLYCPGHAAKLV